MTGVPCLSRVYIGDLHLDENNGWQSRDRLAAIIAEINGQIGDAADTASAGTQLGSNENGKHW